MIVCDTILFIAVNLDRVIEWLNEPPWCQSLLEHKCNYWGLQRMHEVPWGAQKASQSLGRLRWDWLAAWSRLRNHKWKFVSLTKLTDSQTQFGKFSKASLFFKIEQMVHRRAINTCQLFLETRDQYCPESSINPFQAIPKSTSAVADQPSPRTRKLVRWDKGIHTLLYGSGAKLCSCFTIARLFTQVWPFPSP